MAERVCRRSWLAAAVAGLLAGPAAADFVTGVRPAACPCGRCRGSAGGWSTAPVAARSAAEPAAFGQSPVDIRSEDAVFAALPEIAYRHSAGVTLAVQNTGSPAAEANVQAFVPAGAGGLTVGGVDYDLLLFHFHTRAEHRINGRQAEMELHMGYQAAGGEFLVVARTVELGAINPALEPFFANLPPSGASAEVAGFDLGALVPGRPESFRYTGSLTTPPFAGPIAWVVSADPLELSAGQADAFRAVFPDGNARDAQPLGGRRVLTDVPGFAAVPEPSSLALAAAAAAGLWARRRRAG